MSDHVDEPFRPRWPPQPGWDASVAVQLLDELAADVTAERQQVATLRRRVELLERVLVVVAALAVVALVAALA